MDLRRAQAADQANTAGDLRRRYSAFAVAQAYMHGVHRIVAGSGDVRIAVAIEVAHRD